VTAWRKPGRAWCAVAALLALGTALAQAWPAAAIDWQPGLATREPWRAFSAAFVHYSALHLWGNVAGLALTAALGAAARAPPGLALAWLAAWPLTQLGLLAQPGLAHYGGLSGVVHAGVAIVCVHLLLAGHRLLGAAMLGGLLAKVLSETPWGAPLRHAAGWDIAIAPLAHASGLVAGTACALIAEGGARWRRRRSIVGE
jgi:rhomboid family GlyGly-CTERM serine protease